MVSKERDIANKTKREEKSVYNTVLITVIKCFCFAKEMKLTDKAFESDCSIVSDINIKYISNYKHKITKTTLQRYYKKVQS